MLRNGQQVDVTGRWPSAANITERRGAWISGALFAEAETLTSGLIAGSPALMVHHVSPGSDAEASGLQIYDLLLSADGVQIASVEAFMQRARDDRAADRPLELMLLRLTPESQDVLFTHQRRLLTVDDLQLGAPLAGAKSGCSRESPPSSAELA